MAWILWVSRLGEFPPPREDFIPQSDTVKAMTPAGLNLSSLDSVSQELTPVSKALRLQEQMLEQKPVLDYIVCGEHGQEDCGIEILNKVDKMIFRTARYQAPKFPYAVGVMYKKLSEMHPDLEGHIREQMTAEYGIDPASNGVQNAPEPGTEDLDISDMMIDITARWPTMQQLREKSILVAPGNEDALSSWI